MTYFCALYVRLSVCKHIAQIASSHRQIAGSPSNWHTMVPRRTCIQDVLKVKVEFKGHVIRALLWCHEMSAIQYGLTLCVYMRSLYEAPLHSPSSISIRQLDLISKYWNELLRHWRSSFVSVSKLYFETVFYCFCIVSVIKMFKIYSSFTLTEDNNYVE